jgi:hypothetical protein
VRWNIRIFQTLSYRLNWLSLGKILCNAEALISDSSWLQNLLRVIMIILSLWNVFFIIVILRTVVCSSWSWTLITCKEVSFFLSRKSLLCILFHAIWYDILSFGLGIFSYGYLDLAVLIVSSRFFFTLLFIE